MKKILYYFFILFILSLFLGIFYLSTIGFETSRFNNSIIKGVKSKDSNVELELKKIKIKLDLKKIQLFLSTSNPKITYQDTRIPITEIKIYSKLNQIFNTKVKISRATFVIKKFKTEDVKKIAIRIKPSNFKNYLLNNLYGGEIEKASFDISIDKNFTITNYKARGEIKKTNAKIIDNFLIKDISFNFIIDKKLTLINSLRATYDGFLISGGSINLQKKKNIEIKSKFNSTFNLNTSQTKKLFKKIKFFQENLIESEGSLIHEIDLKINNNYKIIDYEYKSKGTISKSNLILKNRLKNSIIKKPIKKIVFQKIKLEINYNKKDKNSFTLDGLYSTDKLNFKRFNIKNSLIKKKQNYFIDFNLSNDLFFDVINFKTNSKNASNIKIEFSITNNNLMFESIDFTEGKNNISIAGLSLNNKKEIKNFTRVKILTFDKNEKKNNFIINLGKKIYIKGESYDSTNLLKLLSGGGKSNLFKNFNKEIAIEIKELKTKSNISLGNFNLIGFIEKGELHKLSAKSEFSEGKYLDVSLKKDPNKKKILEVYSDFPQALLGDYKFFEGIRDGTLLYSSVMDKTGSASKLTIENFRVTKAPTFATLLTLADLRGFADLLSGQGMGFDVLEINMKDDGNVTVVEDILALGNSVSLQMSGYVEKNTGLVSFSGTLVPAKTLNKMVAKIPLVGNILVGNKVGEGIFGVSFKIKGLPGNIKTTVDPLKTITPRFITRALERIKKN